MAYTWLHENLEGEAEKGVLTGGVVLWCHAYQQGGGADEGPKEGLMRHGELVGEELFGGAELMEGSAGLRNN
jgi:hypothetical protein